MIEAAEALPFLRATQSPPTASPLFARVVLGRLAQCASITTAVPVCEIMAKNRRREPAWIRFAIMLIAREAGKSLGQIAAFFDLDHTSILHGARRAKELEVADEGFAFLLHVLRREVRR